MKLSGGFPSAVVIAFALQLVGCGGDELNINRVVLRPADQAASTTLASLTLSSAELDQIFQSSQLEYTSTVGFLMASTKVTPTVEDANATVTVNGTAVMSGNPSESIFLGEGDNVVTVMVAAENGVTTQSYTITVSRQTAKKFAQQAYIKASNTDPEDYFGRVALSADTLAVGAPDEDSAASGINGDQADNSLTRSGAVCVFTREGTRWSQQAHIKASNPDVMDNFGFTVALSGADLAVGAQFEDSAATGIDGDQMNDGADDSGGCVPLSLARQMRGGVRLVRGDSRCFDTQPNS